VLSLLCFAYSFNLRETVKKYGGKQGINIKAVKAYSKQLMAGLKHLASLSIVHADIKPDNILVNANCSTLKFCDFGSGFKADSPDALPTPYLVSRFYRAPEIILGLKYGTPLDVWAVGTW
jgi:serine/threonine-protein kinase PRP4